MNLKKLQQNWDRLGADDPWWAVLSHADKKDGKWDVAEFFATGRALIDDTLDWIRRRGVALEPGRALDFGCGAGRLTQALARHFATVTGVDIAPSMIALAQEAAEELRNCRFLVNDQPDLAQFADGSFDFVCSFIVLQHMEPRFARAYVTEFARVLAPNGVLVFQVPSQPVHTLKGRLRRVLATRLLQPLLNLYKRIRDRRPCAMEMYGVPRERVEALLADCGLQLADTTRCDSAGPNWISYRYLAVKAPSPALAGRG